jgi:predicted nucleic acid-binding protein
MTTFVDTSALIALLDRAEAKHADCARAWKRLLADDSVLVTTSYVVVETCAVAQRRLGMEAVRVLTTDFMPLVSIDWVDESLHAAGHAAMLTANQRDLSLVDCVSFEVMRRRHITRVLALDADFSRQGFSVVP